jgi:hypothetical protein
LIKHVLLNSRTKASLALNDVPFGRLLLPMVIPAMIYEKNCLAAVKFFFGPLMGLSGQETMSSKRYHDRHQLDLATPKAQVQNLPQGQKD